MNKKWLVLVLSIIICAPVFSQDDDILQSSDLQVIASLLVDNPDIAKSSAEKLIKKNKENTELIAAIGRVFLNGGDLDSAKDYFKRAQRCRRISTKAINLGGDIAKANNKLDSAEYYYARSMYFDRKNPEAYYKYANLFISKDVQKSIEALNRLKINRPDINVNKSIADLYYEANDFTKAQEVYESIGPDSLDDKELMQYSLVLYAKKNYQKSLELAQMGHKRNAKDPVFNRLLLYNNTELQNYDDAVKSADDLFYRSKDAKLQYQDYIYYGYALNGQGKTHEAIEQFNIALEKNANLPGINKQISDAYLRINDYDNAIKYYQVYISKLKDGDENRAYELYQLGRLYWRKGIAKQEGNTLTQDQAQAIEQANHVFGEVAALRPNSYLGYYWQAKASSLLDPDYTKGLAKPYYLKAIELLEQSGESKDHLIECYKQLSFYYYSQQAYDMAIEYARKVQTVDPDDDYAKRMIETATVAASQKPIVKKSTTKKSTAKKTVRKRSKR